MTAAREIWHRTAGALSQMPCTCQTIIATHVPDDRGRCRACTVPGRGEPMATWPCGVRQLAELACSIAAGRLAG